MASRHTVKIVAPGAREIRIRQVNNGKDTFIKSGLGETLTFKTLKTQGGRAVNVAKIKVRIFWSNDAGGGDEWKGPINAGSSQTWTFPSPVQRAAGGYAAPTPVPPPAPPQSAPPIDAGGAWTNPTTSWSDPATNWDGGGGAQSGYPAYTPQVEPEGENTMWWVLGTLLGLGATGAAVYRIKS